MQLDDDIRVALGREADSIPTDAAMTRLRQVDYRPRSHAIPPRVAGILAAGAAAGAGTIIAVGSAGTQAAFAGWHASPTRASATRTAAVEDMCAPRLGGDTKDGGKAGTPRVADTRGPYTLIVYTGVTCFAGPGFLGLHGFVAADGIGISTGYEGDQPYTIAAGPAAPDATAATLTLQDGTTVQATVGNSVFAAWWPSASRPSSISITTPSGTRTQPLNYPPAPPGKPAATAQRAKASRWHSHGR